MIDLRSKWSKQVLSPVQDNKLLADVSFRSIKTNQSSTSKCLLLMRTSLKCITYPQSSNSNSRIFNPTKEPMLSFLFDLGLRHSSLSDLPLIHFVFDVPHWPSSRPLCLPRSSLNFSSTSSSTFCSDLALWNFSSTYFRAEHWETFAFLWLLTILRLCSKDSVRNEQLNLIMIT